MSLGIVLPSADVPIWMASVMHTVVESEDARITAATVAPASEAGLGRAGRLLISIYDLVDAAVFGRPDDPGCLVRIPAPVGNLLGADPPAKLDVVLRLDGDHSPMGGWPPPRLGTWTVDQVVGAPQQLRGPARSLSPGDLELLLGRTLAATRLVTAGPERIIIGQVVSRVDQLSVRRGARGHLRKVAAMVSRALARAIANDAIPRPRVHEVPDWDPALPSLSAARIGLGLGRVAASYFSRLVGRGVAPDTWAVAVGITDTPTAVTARPPLRFLEAPSGRTWADPFPVVREGGSHLFLEEVVADSGRGRIARVELDGSRRGWSRVDTVLELPHHLSYPFVFEHEGSWYLMPEQASTGRLEVYRADSFLGRWTWHSTLLELPAKDATMARIQGRWWMFAAIAVRGGTAADELHLFHAPSPLGPWRAHAGNPIASDVRTARAAGRPYEEDGHWHRLAQDGERGYGHSITILRIDRIDEAAYEETVIGVIEPDWAPGMEGTHTLNRDGRLLVMDALVRRPRI